MGAFIYFPFIINLHFPHSFFSQLLYLLSNIIAMLYTRRSSGVVYLHKQSTLVFLVHTWVVQEQFCGCSSPWPCCPHSWWDEIIITGLLMDSGVECIYDCVWVQLCVSPVMPCVQACSQGQTWWVMNKQWQQQGQLGEIQALRPHSGFGVKEEAAVWCWGQYYVHFKGETDLICTCMVMYGCQNLLQ